MKIEINEKIEIPEGIEIKVDNGIVTAKGSKGEVVKNLLSRKINLVVQDKFVVFSATKATKREKRLLGSFKSHLKNMFIGVTEGFTYKLKICSSHFPITVEVKDKTLSISNYLGENVPRTLTLKEGVDVKIEGELINISSPDKELAGTTASSIEELCKLKNKDRRIFQDGIYIIEKSGKPLK